ncbi:MAG: DUF4406 domain-containing protein [Bacteroidales bacterium]|nr:DUF4406 domain-containing protein [Bacteroidales bacterium]
MKIYLSLPITGHDPAQCAKRASHYKSLVEERGHKCITPFDICPDPNLKYHQYMGRDIEELLQCDGILLLTGWSWSKGCQLEWRCAEIYGKKIFHHLNEIEKK